VSVITTPSYGDLTAPFLVKKLKISSPKDTKQLEEAKELAYKEGFYQGVMNYGDFKGEKVEIAKPKVRQQLLDANEGFAYSEPEKKVVSRSGDDCCVALMDQWYLDYGEDSWKQTALKYVDNVDGKGLNTYSQETKNGFEGVLNWLNQWACARTYGLGSRLPWDPQFLVESLSDSTIYMAYYTIAHFLHADIFGKNPGLLGIKPEQMTDEVWDYVFARRDLSEQVLTESKISKESLASMRREFEYWYPLDLRVSGKDLIPNHLTFFLYIHMAMFPPEYWPKGVRANGHLLLNSEKMSKSTGNFMTLDDMVKKYGADASRIALADAGDGVADANFDEDVADNNVLRLFTLREWCEEQVKDQDNLRAGEKNAFLDQLFDNEMNNVVHECRQHYEDTDYKLALKSALYDFTSARDFYREACTAAGIKMHRDLVLRYIELQALIGLNTFGSRSSTNRRRSKMLSSPRFQFQTRLSPLSGNTFGLSRQTSLLLNLLNKRRRPRARILDMTSRNQRSSPSTRPRNSRRGRKNTSISFVRLSTRRLRRSMTKNSRQRYLS